MALNRVSTPKAWALGEGSEALNGPQISPQQEGEVKEEGKLLPPGVGGIFSLPQPLPLLKEAAHAFLLNVDRVFYNG